MTCINSLLVLKYGIYTFYGMCTTLYINLTEDRYTQVLSTGPGHITHPIGCLADILLFYTFLTGFHDK